MKTLTRSFVLAIALLVVSVMAALAGGWAVITVDQWPGQTTAGQTFALGFTVRQHGKTLRDDLTPTVHFGRSDAAASFTVTARREGASGHYIAAVTFPSTGQWNWRVDLDQFGMITQDMPPFNVSASIPVAPSAAAYSLAMPLVIGLTSLIGAASLLAIWLRTRARWALALLGVVAAMGIGGLVASGSSAAFGVSSAQADLGDRGKALFEAKGCVMCHTNAAFRAGSGPYFFGDPQPPNLTRVALDADYLRKWLKNPAALKPGTAMPDLGLQPDEIEALIAFLKDERN